MQITLFRKRVANSTSPEIASLFGTSSERSVLEWLSLIDCVRFVSLFMEIARKKLEIILLIIWLLLVLRLHFNHTHFFLAPSRKHFRRIIVLTLSSTFSWFVLFSTARSARGPEKWIIKLCVITFSAFGWVCCDSTQGPRDKESLLDKENNYLLTGSGQKMRRCINYLGKQ